MNYEVNRDEKPSYSFGTTKKIEKTHRSTNQNFLSSYLRKSRPMHICISPPYKNIPNKASLDSFKILFTCDSIGIRTSPPFLHLCPILCPPHIQVPHIIQNSHYWGAVQSARLTQSHNAYAQTERYHYSCRYSQHSPIGTPSLEAPPFGTLLNYQHYPSHNHLQRRMMVRTLVQSAE